MNNFFPYHSAFAVTTGPASEPITAAEVKLQTKVDYTAEDSLITIQIQAVREYVEKKLGIALLPQTVTEMLSAFPEASRLNPYRAIRLKRYPLRGITSIQYKDEDGASQTLASSEYVTDATGADTTPFLAPAYEKEWPDTYNEFGAITITYTAGYDDAASVPAQIKQAMLLIVADWFDNRENSVQERETAADRLLFNIRGFRF